jgi:hypothetical protein
MPNFELWRSCRKWAILCCIIAMVTEVSAVEILQIIIFVLVTVTAEWVWVCLLHILHTWTGTHTMSCPVAADSQVPRGNTYYPG